MIFKNKYVHCEECGVVLQIEKAQKIKVSYGDKTITEYYCQAHTKQYDEMDSRFFGNTYYKTIKVDENGKEIKAKV